MSSRRDITARAVELSVPPDADAAAYERTGYVIGLRTANVGACSAW